MVSETARLRTRITENIVSLGFPEVFGTLICDELKTEVKLRRMLSYLIQSKPRTMEETADEMLCIKEEYEKYHQRKISEYANRRYNEIVNGGI